MDDNLALEGQIVFMDKTSGLSWVHSRSWEIKVLMSMIMIVSFVCGSFSKFVIYRYLKRERERPINILIMIDQAIHHFSHGLLILFYSLSLIFNLTWKNILGSTVPCWLFVYIGIFGIAHVPTSSFCMALFRIMYMKKETWVRYVIGEWKLLNLLIFVSILHSTIITFLYVDGPRGRMTIYTFCTGNSEEYELIKQETEIAGGQLDLGQTKVLILHWGIFLEVTEIFLYFTFFKHLYDHNSNLAVMNILQRNIIQARHRKNAISMIGQIYSFSIEIVFILLLIVFLITKLFPSNMKEAFIMIKINEFGLRSVAQALLSSELRTEAFRYFKRS